MALHWAPIHYQAIRKNDGLFNRNALKGKSDSLSTFDFDNDWKASNNWNNLKESNAIPAVYYYVAATATHYFITYAYFHPRDWTYFNFFHLGQHENDLEGILLVVEKDNTKWGNLILGYSVFHLSLKRFLYIESSKHLTTRSDRYKVGSTEESYHPVSYQQPRGHGVKLNDSFFKPRRSYCRYIPKNVDASTKNDTHYQLIYFLDSGQLFDQRNNTELFNEDETIRGTHGEGAKPPWLWTDRIDVKENPDIRLFTDPANYVLMDCSFESPYSTEYIYHPFLNLTK